MSTVSPAAGPRSRSRWRSVALPAEHGGWGLTLEPVVLGLAVAPSWAGVALGGAGLLAFLLRTPLKLALVDRRRGRSLPRTALARRVAVGEASAIVALGAASLVWAGPAWLVPVALAAPLVGLELWFDVRSRSRRLIPEMCGAVGMAALAAAVTTAGEAPAATSVAVWALLAARSVSAVPYVRFQVLRLHGRAGRGPWRVAAGSQLVGSLAALAVVGVEPAAVAGAATVVLTAVVRVVGLARPPSTAVRLGALESVLGAVVVVATAVGLHLGGAT